MTWTPEFLSASVDGAGILVADSTLPGTLINTATAIAGQLEQVRLYAVNNNADDVELYILWGGVATKDLVRLPVPSRQGLFLEIPQLRLKNGKEIRAYTPAGINLITIHGSKEIYSPS